MNQRWIYMPVEIKSRELHARIYLAVAALHNGFGVVLGEMRTLDRRLIHYPAGILVDKSLTRRRAQLWRKISKKGFLCTAGCEEGLVTLDAFEYLNRRVHPMAMEQARLVFCWGRAQAEKLIQAVPKPAVNLKLTGNPRIDLLRHRNARIFEAEVEAIRARYGDFVLVNTNFSLCNGVDAENSGFKTLQQTGKIVSPRLEEFYSSLFRYKQQLMEEFVALIHRLASTGYRVVLRPHPAESVMRWERKLLGLENVIVVREGNVIPWLKAARALVHNGCTTAVEARLLGKPVIGYEPSPSKANVPPLTFGLGKQAQTAEQVEMLLRENEGAGRNAEPLSSNERKLVEQHVNHFETGDCAREIVREITKLPCPETEITRNATTALWQGGRRGAVRFKNWIGHLTRLASRDNETEAWRIRDDSNLRVAEVLNIISKMTDLPNERLEIVDLEPGMIALRSRA